MFLFLKGLYMYGMYMDEYIHNSLCVYILIKEERQTILKSIILCVYMLSDYLNISVFHL